MSDERSAARILVVDDTRLDRELGREALAHLGRVEDCASAEEALAALRREPADLVLSDLNMPGLSGVELLERVRREHPGTDFVLLTADATVDSAVRALRMGAADYLQKPIRPEQLERVARQVLERRRLLEENRRLREAVRTVEACRALAPCLDPGEVYAVALDLLLHALSRRRGISLFHRSALSLQDAAAFRGLSEEEARGLRAILVEEKPVDFESLDGVQVVASGPLHESMRRVGIDAQRVLAVSVRGEQDEAGLVWVLEDGRSFDEDELERARIIAGHAAAALRNAERYERAKERAFVDDVTDIFNARYLLSATEHEIRRAERYEHPLSVLFLDLDRFKLVNDRYGHLVGSQTLRRLSQVLQQCVRQVDTLARYGGDEFTILLVDTAHPDALAIAERIRRTVEGNRFEAGRDAALRLTLSVGVATYPDHGRTRDELLDKADKAMYLAKSQGRNRVCSAHELDA
jgi:diguanylate cyclase (GGDEF)-like protein